MFLGDFVIYFLFYCFREVVVLEDILNCRVVVVKVRFCGVSRSFGELVFRILVWYVWYFWLC